MFKHLVLPRSIAKNVTNVKIFENILNTRTSNVAYLKYVTMKVSESKWIEMAGYEILGRVGCRNGQSGMRMVSGPSVATSNLCVR